MDYSDIVNRIVFSSPEFSRMGYICVPNGHTYLGIAGVIEAHTEGALLSLQFHSDEDSCDSSKIALFAYLCAYTFIPYGEIGMQYVKEKLGDVSIPERRLAGMRAMLRHIDVEVTPEIEETMRAIVYAPEGKRIPATFENLIAISERFVSWEQGLGLDPNLSVSDAEDRTSEAWFMLEQALMENPKEICVNGIGRLPRRSCELRDHHRKFLDSIPILRDSF